MRRLRTRVPLWMLGAMLVLALTWQLSRAQTPIPPVNQPIQAQIQLVVTSLLTSEANNATGTHIPGVGVVFTMDLIRGPNTLPDKNPFDGTRDWMIYLMQTFGAQMTTVPESEIVAMSVDLYDYERTVNHQLVITSRRADIADPTKYSFSLNSKPYAEAVAELLASPSASPPAAAPTVAVAATPVATPVAATPIIETGPLSVTLDFADGAADAAAWAVVGGTWQVRDEAYEQTELARFDLISFFDQSLGGDVRVEAEMRYVTGEMGGGLIFNAPSNTSKAGGHIVSYTAGGTFLQYGYFDQRGVFQYQGGTAVDSGADGQPHVLAARAVGDVYEVTLDGTPIAQDIPLQRRGGYAGVFVSTSQVIFDNVKLESTQP